MTIGEFETELNNRLNGKAYEGYGWQSTTTYTIIDMLKELGFNTDKIWYRQFHKGNSFTIYYENTASLFTVEVKKKKGKTHQSWAGTYCDWTFGHITVYGEENKSVGDCWTEMMTSYHKQNNAEALKKEQAIEVVQYVMQKYGFKSYWDAAYFFEYIGKNKYSLSEEAQKRIQATEAV